MCAQCQEEPGEKRLISFFTPVSFCLPSWVLNLDFFFFFFLTCETSDIYRLNFICVSVKHLGHSLSEQLFWT